MRTVEAWALEKRPPAWVQAGVLVEHPPGKSLTEAEYDAACEAVKNHPIGDR